MLIFGEKIYGREEYDLLLIQESDNREPQFRYQTDLLVQSYEKLKKGLKALSLPTHSATKLMSNLPEKSWASARSSYLSNWRVCWL